MISKEKILGKLPPFKNEVQQITENQSYSDIEQAILNAHLKYADQYLKIAPFFYKGSFYKSAKFLFQWVVENIPYKIESSYSQKIKSPAAIIATHSSDCKNYSLFIGGVLQGLEKLYFPGLSIKYRFANYSGGKYPEHVYVIANYKGEEIILDAVTKKFNIEEIYYFHIDKKPKNMALHSINGLSNCVCDTGAAVGNNPLAMIDPTGGFLSNLISKIKIRRKGCSSEDWQGWDAQDVKNRQGVGSSVRGYVLRDDRDAACEALNVLSYIQANGLDNLILNGPAETIPGTAWRNVTFEEIANKLRRGGLVNEANEFLQNMQFRQPLPNLPNTRSLSIPANSSFQLKSGAGSAPASSLFSGGTQQPAGGGSNIPLLIGGAAIAIFFLLRKK